MTYKNIVFDLDDTLYDHLLPFKNSIIQYFPEIDISEIELIYKRFRYWSDIAFPKYTNKQISIEELPIDTKIHEVQTAKDLKELIYRLL